MQTTGIVRRVDELGRVVVPKEIRNSLRIKNGDCLEFFVDNGKIVLIRHNVFNNIDSMQTLIDIVSKILEGNFLITDDNKVLYAGGTNSKVFKEKEITKNIYNTILTRKEFVKQRW